MWLSFSINGILRFLRPDLIWSELNFISLLRWSAFFASLIALMELATIEGLTEEVNIKPGAKLLMKSMMSALAAT